MSETPQEYMKKLRIIYGNDTDAIDAAASKCIARLEDTIVHLADKVVWGTAPDAHKLAEELLERYQPNPKESPHA